LRYYKVLFYQTNFSENAEGGRKEEVGLGCFYSLGRFSGLRYDGIGSSQDTFQQSRLGRIL
jgi:hypothetical protein